METILECGLSNAVMATALALLAAVVGTVCRRPVLVHSLWLLVLLKLVTPPLIRIPVIPVSSPPDASTIVVTGPPVRSEMELAAQKKTVILSASEESHGSHDETLRSAQGDIFHGSLVPRSGRKAPPSDRPAVPAVAVGPVGRLAADPVRARASWELESTRSSNVPATSGMSIPPLRTAHLWMVFYGIWLTGAAMWFAGAANRIARFGRLVRYATPAPEELQTQVSVMAARLGLARCPEVLLMPGEVSPMVWAIGGRSRLLLPRDLLAHLDDQQLATLVTHELAHLRRRDHWVRLLELVATGLYWWHPVVWWARRRVWQAEEEACDAWVVWTLPTAAETYATALLKSVDFLSGAPPALPPAASGVGHVQLLKRRLTMIMQGTTPKTLSVSGRLAVVALGALLPLAPTWTQNQAGATQAEAREKPRQVRRDAEGSRAADRERLEQLMRDIGRLLVEGNLDEAQELAAEARELKQRLGQRDGHRKAAALKRQVERISQKIDADTRDALRDPENRQNERDGDRKARAQERQVERFRLEIDTEIREALREAQAEVREAQAELEEQLSEAFEELRETDIAKLVTETLQELDVEELVQEALQALQEIDVGKVIEEALQGVDPDLDVDVEKLRRSLPKVEVEVDVEKTDGESKPQRVKRVRREKRSEKPTDEEGLERRVMQLETRLRQLLEEVEEVQRALQGRSSEAEPKR